MQRTTKSYQCHPWRWILPVFVFLCCDKSLAINIDVAFADVTSDSKIVLVNLDDDDGDGQPDKDQTTGPYLAEDDLQEINVSVQVGDEYDGDVKIEVETAGRDKIKLWADEKKKNALPANTWTWTVPITDGVLQPVDGTNPVKFWVEGIKASATTDDVVIKATLSNGDVDEVKLTLLPVDIEEVISDQIAGNEANKLPTAFYKGEPNNPMFMATRSGVNARLMVKMNVTASVASKILVGARKVGSAPILGSVVSVAPPGKTPLSFDAYDGHHIYEIVAGYDANSSGVLETGEVAAVFSKTPNTDSAGGVVSAGLANLDKIIIATQSAFDSGKSGAIGNNVWGTDYAGDLLSAFAHGSSSVAEGTTTSPHTIISKQPGLSHPVGAKWSPTFSADTHRVSFYNGSEAANDVNASYALPQVLESAIGTHLTAIRAASGSSWTYSGPYNFSVSRDLVVTEPEWIGLNELGYAFGKVTFIGTMHVSSRWVAGGKIEVGSVTYSGQFDDVYDFTYWGGDKAREASLTQVGHATLASAPEPNSGKVFFTRVVFSGTKSIGKEF